MRNIKNYFSHLKDINIVQNDIDRNVWVNLQRQRYCVKWKDNMKKQTRKIRWLPAPQRKGTEIIEDALQVAFLAQTTDNT